MTSLLSAQLLSGAFRETLAVVLFRALPVATCALLTPQLRLGSRLLMAGLLGAALWLAASSQLLPEHWLFWLLLAHAYLTMAACAVPAGARLLRATRLTRCALFIAACTLFLVVPAVTWPPFMKAPALVLGWDLTLSAYSYCIEVAGCEREPTRSECLFFLLVNPVLVYRNRGIRCSPPRLSLSGLGRALVGILTLFVASGWLAPLQHAVSRQAVRAPDSLTSDAAVVAMLAFLTMYARHSGLASLQIGMLRQLGWRIPERYEWPVLAASVPDFWRRWNRYVGEWALLYVFQPVSMNLGRKLRGRRVRPLAPALGVVLTFVAVGLYHDAYAYADGFLATLQLTRAFLISGLIVVPCSGVARLAHAATRRMPAASLSTLSMTFAVLSRMGFWIALIATMTWLV